MTAAEKNGSSLSFIHISDTHIGNSRDFSLYNHNTFERTRKLIELINGFCAPVDFVMNTGDVVNRPDTNAYQLVSELFSDLLHPVFFLPGNHDNPGETVSLSATYGFGFSEMENHSYQFSLNGCKFLTLNCTGSPRIDPHGEFTPVQERVLSQFLSHDEHLRPVLFIHFPAIATAIPWIDREMLILNGERLHELLVRSGKISTVFFGHIHRRVSFIKDGIHYISAPSPVCQFSLLPSDQKASYESDIPLSFNYVTFCDGFVFIREITPGCGGMV
ncbi:3',5'-cyclic-nucleotide phosphodiesterase [Chitinispirillum alkaliphilum]|nr:3',5'-cyclic-nucleotide phosphodiesterase [Chitinispirillum alkaliphilum]